MSKALEHKRTMNKARYMRLKLAGKCVDCTAILQDDDGIRCVECSERALDVNRRHAAKPRMRRVRSQWAKSHRAARAAAGLCLYCGRPADAGRHCEEHRARHALRQRENRARRKAGIVSLPRRKQERARAQDDSLYNPVEDVLATPTVRILRALRFFDWVGADCLLDAMGVPEFVSRAIGSNTERNTITAMLGRLVTDGLVERRGHKPKCEYLITAAGRAALAEMIGNGQIKRRRAA